MFSQSTIQQEISNFSWKSCLRSILFDFDFENSPYICYQFPVLLRVGETLGLSF